MVNTMLNGRSGEHRKQPRFLPHRNKICDELKSAARSG